MTFLVLLLKGKNEGERSTKTEVLLEVTVKRVGSW